MYFWRLVLLGVLFWMINFTCDWQNIGCSETVLAATSDNIRTDRCAQGKFRSDCASIWTESSLAAFWIAEHAKFLRSTTTTLIRLCGCRRRIWDFVGCTCQKVRFLTLRFIWIFGTILWRQISDDICRLLFYFNKLSFGKTFICKVEGLNVKQRRSRWDGSLSRLIWIYVVCKSYYYRLWQ